jgi:metal-responsive CopG/Arc/MetJ family transcriptional regulator
MKKDSVTSVVKVDSILLGEIDKIIKKEEYRLKFVNKKQFVDLAIQDYLKKLKEEKNGKKK